MLDLNFKNKIFILIFCLLSIWSFGQNLESINPNLNLATNKSSGMLINSNLGTTQIRSYTQSAENQLTQIQIADFAVETIGTGTNANTRAVGDYRTKYTDGAYLDLWGTLDTWETYNGSSWVNATTVPNTNAANVLIRAGSIIIIDNTFTVGNIIIEGTLQFDWRGAKVLNVYSNVTVTGNGDFQTSAVQDQYEDNTFQKLFHRLTVKGNIVNNANLNHGILFNDYATYGSDDFSSLVEVRFVGIGNSEWSGTGENDLGGLTIQKDNANDVVTIKPNKLLGWHSADQDWNGFFMYDKIEHKGVLKIGGTYNMVTRFGINSGSNAAYEARQLPRISSLASGNNFTLIIDNPNFGIAGSTSVECYGNLRITKGSMNVGSTLDNYIEFHNNSSLTVDGGDLVCTGSINYRETGSFNLNLSAGKIRAGYFGNSLSNTRGWFDIRNNATVNISGGEIHLINPSFTTSLVYPMYYMAATNVTITGGKLFVGSSASPNGINTFSIAGPTPSIELYSSASIKSNAIMWNNVQCYGNLSIPVDCGFSIYDQDHSDIPYIFSITGNINHLGDLYAEVTNSKILFNGTSAQTFNSTGSYANFAGTAGISIVEVNNTAGVLLTGNGTSVTKTFIKTNGTFNIGSCYLNLYGVVTRTAGYLGGTLNSTLNIYGTGNLGNLYFDPAADKLKILNLQRTSSGIINLATNLNIINSINFTNGILYTYKDNNVANGSQTILLAPSAQLITENINSYIYGKVSISNAASASFGNIGTTMSSLSELGNTTIARITGTEGIKIIPTDNPSIACHWDIQVQNQPISTISTTFKWLSPFDNSLPNTDMQAYTLRTPNPWETVGNATNVTGNPRTITVDAAHFSIWTVAQNVIPTITPTFDQVGPYCEGATIPALTTISNEGINGTWLPAIDNSATTVYTFTPNIGEDATLATLTITITPKETPTFDAVGPYCEGSTIPALTTTSNEGITGTWSPAINSSATTVYTFTPDAGECAITTTLTITISSEVTPTFDAVGPYCEGSMIPALTTISNEAITGTWAPAINSTSTTEYTFTPNTSGCATTATLTITITPKETPIFDAVGPYCEGSTIPALTTTSNEGITGTWSPAINSSATTVYTFTPDAGECATTQTLTITVTPNITPTFDAVAPICEGETLSALSTTSNNGITGTWAPALDNTQTTEYTFTPTGGECATTATLTITVNSNIAPTFDAVAPICAGETLSSLPTTSNDGITGTWAPALDNTQTTTYTFTPTLGQCSSTIATLTIVVNPNITPTFDAVAPICAGATLSALTTTSNNSITGTWSPALDNTQTTEYTFTPSVGQCATTATLTITVTPNITPTFDAVGPYCVSSTIAALPTISNEAISGTWSPAIDNTTTTTYTFTPDMGECVATATLTISIINDFDATITSALSHCHAENSVALTANTIGGIWEGANIVLLEDQYYFMFKDVNPGEYQVIYHFDGLCGDADTVIFTIYESFDATIYPLDTLFVDGEPVIVETANPNGIWSGDYLIENNLFVPASAGIGEFEVIYTIEGMCGDSDTTKIIVIATPIADLLAATAVTPDADGFNDTWRIRGIEAYNNVSIRIFTRWGDEIFVFDGTGAQYLNPINQWDGKHNNQKLPSGVYVYIISVENNKSYSGTISLIR